MRLGLDISTLAERSLVNQIVMIAGDSDFVLAAKHAMRSGIDFILDPMWSPITDSLSKHIDGIRECVTAPPDNKNDPMHADNMDREHQGQSTSRTADTDDDEL